MPLESCEALHSLNYESDCSMHYANRATRPGTTVFQCPLCIVAKGNSDATVKMAVIGVRCVAFTALNARRLIRNTISAIGTTNG